MFGMFAKPNLNLKERSYLLLHLVHVNLMVYFKHDVWASEDNRALAIDHWMKLRGKKGGVMFRAKISQMSDEMTRFIVASQSKEDAEELYSFLNSVEESGEKSDPQARDVVAQLLAECEKALIAKGLAS